LSAAIVGSPPGTAHGEKRQNPGRDEARRIIFEAVNYSPHAGQQPIHDSEARMRVCACGRRFGKSVIGGHELVCEAFYGYGERDRLLDLGLRREFWIVGPEYSDSEKEFRVLWNKTKAQEMPFDKPGSYNNPDSGQMVLSLWDGTTIFHAKSAKYPSTLVGEGLRGVVMAEAAKMKSTVWNKYIRPTLADTRGWALFLSTPEGKNWFYDLYMRGIDPEDEGWDGFRRPSWANPIIFPKGADAERIEKLLDYMRNLHVLNRAVLAELAIDEEIVDMARDMSEEKFKQEIGADFTEFVGRVFKRFEEETHVGDLQELPGLPLYGAVDYGWTNPFVWLDVQVDYDGNINVLNEYYQYEKDANEHAAWLRAHGRTNERYKFFFPDPARPDDTHTLTTALRIPARSNTGGDLSTRLELIRNALKNPGRGITESGVYYPRPRLMIDRKCRNLIREMNDYRYPETKEEAQRNPKDVPMDKDDHGPEALGRFMRGMYGKVERRRTRMRQAQMQR
jgi:hypothetical protein